MESTSLFHMVIQRGKVKEIRICIRTYWAVRQQQGNGPIHADGPITQDILLTLLESKEKIKHSSTALRLIFG